MKIYADRPTRRVRQLVGDALLLVALWLCSRLGHATHDRVAAIGDTGRTAQDAGLRFEKEMRSAARSVKDLPLVGGSVSKPFRAVAGSGRELADAAAAFQDSVAHAANVLGLLVALVPMVVVLLLWLPRRIAWIVEATAATRLARLGSTSSDLLAVRASPSAA